jgi:hypothetical protein
MTSSTGMTTSTGIMRHPAVDALLPYFESDHLPRHLQAVSAPCARLAQEMAAYLPSNPELTVGLRKLLEAKDCFVRAALGGGASSNGKEL